MSAGRGDELRAAEAPTDLAPAIAHDRRAELRVKAGLPEARPPAEPWIREILGTLEEAALRRRRATSLTTTPATAISSHPSRDTEAPGDCVRASRRPSRGGNRQRQFGRPAPRTPTRPPVLTLRRLQVALGMIWLLDAALQYQPFMFSRGFADTVVLPSARHNPAPIAGSVTWAAHQILARPILANAAFATAQLVLALGILWRPTVRIALAASIGWSLGVWWFGEGLGGVLTDRASPLNGAPGAAVLYALAAILLWPRHPGEDSGRASRPPGRATRLMWVLLWGSLSYLALEPTNRSPGSVRATIASTAAGEPQFIRALDHAAAALLAGGGTAVSMGFGLLLALSATAVLLPGRLERIVLACSIAPALLIAGVGENLGGILTGTATDPSTGPLLILLALGFLNAADRTLRGNLRRGRVSSASDRAHAHDPSHRAPRRFRGHHGRALGSGRSVAAQQGGEARQAARVGAGPSARARARPAGAGAVRELR